MLYYLRVWVSANYEADWSWATFTEDGIGFTEGSVTKTDCVHLQYLISPTAWRSIESTRLKNMLT